MAIFVQAQYDSCLQKVVLASWRAPQINRWAVIILICIATNFLFMRAVAIFVLFLKERVARYEEAASTGERVLAPPTTVRYRVRN